MPTIYQYKNEADYVLDATQAIEDFVLWKLAEQTSISIALSGGNSPKKIYQVLSQNKKIDWSKIELFMVDERYVSKDSKQSNFKMIEENLLSKLPPLKGFYDFNTQIPLEESAEQYDELLEKRGGKLFDLVLLGMGVDGHIASLFPHSETLKEKIKLATTSKSPDGLSRLTLTFPALFSSDKIMLLIQGKEKKETLKAMVSKEKMELNKLPAKMILKHPHVEIYYCAT